jgi:hypothetical protein
LSAKQGEPRLDVSKIPFPGDSVTLGDMRAEQPREFGNPDCRHWHMDQVEAMHMLFDQVILAEKAYAKAIGRPDPHPDTSRQWLYSRLNSDYKKYGISKGVQTTRVLLRGVEAAAEAQAKEYLGHAR